MSLHATATIHCRACGNALLPGISSGRLRCPACGTLLRRPGAETSSSSGLFSHTRRIVLGITLLVGLAVATGIGLQRTISLRTGPVKPVVPAPRSAIDPIQAVEMFDRKPLASVMRDFLITAGAATAPDRQDYGAEMAILTGWRHWFSYLGRQRPNNIPAIQTRNTIGPSTADWPTVLEVYGYASSAPHTRQDHRQLLDAWSWIRSAGKQFSPATPAVPPPPAESCVSSLTSGSPLADIVALQHRFPAEPYGWRRHAELLIDRLAQRSPGARTPQERRRLLTSIDHDLGKARQLSYSAVAQALLTRLKNRLAHLRNVSVSTPKNAIT